MTYLVYCAWIISLLFLAGEVDGLVRRWLGRRYEQGLTAPFPWYVPPFVSMAVPGAGQFLNRQPVKALLVFLWPVLVGFSIFPRPWQTLMMSTRAILAPWYVLMVLDALIVGIIRHRESRREEAPPDRGGEDEMVIFLDRWRQKNQTGS